ncbi:hypothetical protein Ancab_008725 [Ancistrocladus abbreviatus]
MGKWGMSKKPVGLPIVQSMDKILLLNRLQAAAEEGDHAKDEKNAGLGNLEGSDNPPPSFDPGTDLSLLEGLFSCNLVNLPGIKYQ